MHICMVGSSCILWPTYLHFRACEVCSTTCEHYVWSFQMASALIWWLSHSLLMLHPLATTSVVMNGNLLVNIGWVQTSYLWWVAPLSHDTKGYLWSATKVDSNSHFQWFARNRPENTSMLSLRLQGFWTWSICYFLSLVNGNSQVLWI